MSRRLAWIVIAAAMAGAAPRMARGDADGDWQQIEAMDHGSPSGDMSSREEARAATLDYLAKQETVLRDFETNYPADPRVFDAELRLAHLLAARAALTESVAGRRAAEAILDRLATDPRYKDRRADVAFARLSLFMQGMDTTSPDQRAELLERVRDFANDYPADRRLAALLAETGELFQNQPKTAVPLLKDALDAATDDPMREQINDDLKRVAMLGKPLRMRWTSVQGEQVNLEKLEGKVVLIYFFADWSTPSMAELGWVRQLAAAYPPDQVQALGICLNRDPVGVASMLGDHDIGWPVYCDGDGWTGQLVRGLGLNAIPALWIVDRDGALRSLDAKQDADATIQRLLSEPQ